MAGPFKMKGSPMQRNFGIGGSRVEQSPMNQVELGWRGKRVVSKVKKGIETVTKKASEFIKSFTPSEIKKRKEKRFREYVKKSNINPEKYPPKSSAEFN